MKERGSRKLRIGKVSSDRMDKTITVDTERKYRHPLYKKVVKKTTRFKAHDEKNEARVGDLVEIMETRPLSKTKRWRLAKVIERARTVEEEGSK